MLETEFFATPTPVIAKMVQPLIKISSYNSRKFFPFENKAILDPEGGAGDILDYVCEQFGFNQKKLFAIEINQDLRFTLSGKGYRVIGTDFLEYDEPCRFDLILMNPPFSVGVQHVLKGWDVLNDGGHLVGLLNAQSLRNPFCPERIELLKILSHCAGINYNPSDCLDQLLAALETAGAIDWLGACFKDSERPTTVEVVLIRLHKPEHKKQVFSDVQFELDPDFSFDKFSANTLAHRDAIANLVSRYKAARKILIDRADTQSNLDFYLQDVSRPVTDSPECKHEESLLNSVNLNTQLMILKSRFWNTVFDKTDVGRRTTSDFHKKFASLLLCQSAIAFTEANVREVLFLFLNNINQMMQDSLVKIFDEATSHHEKNKLWGEGWKTNKSWKLNKRIIMPYMVTLDNWGSFSIGYSRREFLHDLDKIMCWLSASKLENIQPAFDAIGTFIDEVNRNKGQGYQAQFESTFFKIKIFKKGTLHLDFKNLDILKEFNRIAAENKQWLGSEQPLA